MSAETPRRYRIRAQLLCHDIRLNTWIEVVVALPQAPGRFEAERLLAPDAEKAVDAGGCGGCGYQLFELSIAPDPE